MTEDSKSTTGITIEEAASRLSIPQDQVRGLIEAGALKTNGSGDSLRVTPDSLLMYMASRLTADLQRFTKRPSRPAAVGSAFVPLLLGMWFMAVCVLVFSLRGQKPIAPVPASIAVLAAVLALAWWLARLDDGFFSVNGLGTTLYGRRTTPEGRVGTQWLIIAGVPLLPMRSYVILEVGDPSANWIGSIRKTEFRLRPLGRVYWPQALPILAGVWAGLAALLSVAVLI